LRFTTSFLRSSLRRRGKSYCWSERFIYNCDVQTPSRGSCFLQVG